ncbi:hypothetical protein NPIL_390761, partial [Nephila pilipes]
MIHRSLFHILGDVATYLSSRNDLFFQRIEFSKELSFNYESCRGSIQVNREEIYLMFICVPNVWIPL